VLSGELPYVDLVPSDDITELYNEVRVSIPGEPDPAVARDQASVNAYGYRPLALSLDLTSWDSAVEMAKLLLSKHKDPATRYDAITLKPNDALWPQVLGRDLGDRITVVDRPPAGTATTAPCWIEGVSHEFSGLKWKTSWQLSPASNSSYWTVEHPTLGIIDSAVTIAF
jgi:hypothetical protein